MGGNHTRCVTERKRLLSEQTERGNFVTLPSRALETMHHLDGATSKCVITTVMSHPPPPPKQPPATFNNWHFPFPFFTSGLAEYLHTHELNMNDEVLVCRTKRCNDLLHEE